MECAEHWPSLEEYLTAFSRKADERRVPTTGSISLTDRCNWDCVHCYTGPHRNADQARTREEMSTDRVMACVDQVAEAGCLNLLISGGEPLLRRDFPAIYERAKTNGMLVTVFTNGTLIDENILDLFRDLPPSGVEITVYGAAASTHDSITRTPGSFDRCLAGIDALRRRGIRLKLKTILMTLNRDEWREIQELARSRRLGFRMDAAIFPTLEGVKSPLQLRVSAREAVAFEFADSERADAWTRYFSRGVAGASSKELYQCGAGQRTFHIDPTGKLRPCLMVRNEEYAYDLKAGSFQSGWSGVVAGIRQATPRAGYTCNQCEKRTLCGLCPGFNRMENAREDEASGYVCALGDLRYKAIRNRLSEKGTR